MEKVYKFKSGIYPPTVFITIERNINVLKDKYMFCDNKNLTEENINLYDDVYNALDTSGIVGFPVMDKDTRELGIMLLINSIDNVDTGTIAHEAVHIADYIYQFIGGYSQDFSEGNECYAYLVGWAADCIFKVVKEYKDDKRRINSFVESRETNI